MTFNRLRVGVRYLALLILAACVSSVSLNAQSTTQGSIAGSVLDSSEAVVPGATVNIVNAATGFTVNLVADSSGYFKAPLLEPGKYTVSISSPNFAKYRAEDVLVVVGQVTTLEPRLAVASASTEVIVTEQAPVMNLESPDFSDTLNAKAMQNIPINNRRWSALALTTPGVTVDTSGYGLVSIRGVSTLLNNVEIEPGADDNQAFFAEERGRTREAYSTAGKAPYGSSLLTPAYIPLNTAAPPVASSLRLPRAAPTSFTVRLTSMTAKAIGTPSMTLRSLQPSPTAPRPKRTSSPRTCARSTASPPAGR